MSDEDVRGLLPVLGSLLAAYGFFFNAVHARIAAALEPPKITDAREMAAEHRRRRYPNVLAAALGGSAVVVAAAFVQPAWTLVWQQVHDRPDYSATRAGFVLLELFWVGVAVASTWQAVRLTRLRHRLRPQPPH